MNTLLNIMQVVLQTTGHIINALSQVLFFLLGYVYAIVLGHWVIQRVSNTIWDSNPLSKKIRLTGNTPQFVGFLERGLYVASFQVQRPEFIAAWLVLKAAGNWKGWEGSINSQKDIENYTGAQSIGRYIYNAFLIGTGLSLAYGVVGWLMIKYLQDHKIVLGFGIPIIFYSSTELFYAVIRHYHKKLIITE